MLKFEKSFHKVPPAMLSKSIRSFGLTLLLSCTLLCPPLQAKTLIYRSEAEVQLTHPEDYSLGLFLAQQAAEQRAFAQAEPELLKAPFLRGVKLSAAERHALVKLLARDVLHYNPTDARAPLYKYKLTYDTLKFPEKYSDYQVDYLGEIAADGYAWQYKQNLQQQVVDYLSRVNGIQDENQAHILRLTEGKKLFDAITALSLIDEAFTMHSNKKYDKAFALSNQAIETQPNYIVGYLMKISVLIGQFKANNDTHKLDEALKTSTELLDKYPQDPYLYMVRAALYLYQDVIPAQGIQDIEKAIALHPVPVPAIYDLLMGMIAKKSKQATQSQQAFQRACDKGIQEACQPSKLPKIDMN